MFSDIYKKQNIKLKKGSLSIIIEEFNKRIKIVNLNGDIEELTEKINPIIENNNIGKIFCVVTKEKLDIIKKHDFFLEAKINCLINNEDGYFLSKFCNHERKVTSQIPEEEEILIKAREYLKEEFAYNIHDKYLIRNATKNDAQELARIYDGVFETYPSPMNNSQYIAYAMDNDVMFKVAVYNNKIISSASADMNSKYLNAEITDCATLNNFRGEGLMGRLIYELENELRQMNYNVLYSTARALSPGMNIVFAKHEYEYGGRLVNHCHICGKFENMNIWSKPLN